MTASLNVVFCDDIRTEINGKLIVIGVYPDDLVPAFLPQTIAVSVWARLRHLEPGNLTLTAKAGFNNVVQHEFTIQVEVKKESNSAHLYLVGLPIQVVEPGAIFFSVSGVPAIGTHIEELPIKAPQNVSEAVPAV